MFLSNEQESGSGQAVFNMTLSTIDMKERVAEKKEAVQRIHDNQVFKNRLGISLESFFRKNSISRKARYRRCLPPSLCEQRIFVLIRRYFVIAIARGVAIPIRQLPGLSGAKTVKIIGSLPITARTTRLFLDLVVYVGDINEYIPVIFILSKQINVLFIRF